MSGLCDFVFRLVRGEVVVVEERFWTLAIVRASLGDGPRCSSYLGLPGGANVLPGGCGLMKQVEEVSSPI